MSDSHITSKYKLMNKTRLLKESRFFYNSNKKKGAVIMMLRKRFGVFLICATLIIQASGCGNSDEPARSTENAGTENTERPSSRSGGHDSG